ncbi:hypothetical protein GCM10010266_10240 [Streptomyces griseomycini]|nr:hypothetical protein GCM10010266_10240 [Streptomyces griseomycini]GGR17405.1 hypothetical protein GCM10015536_23850 [Streptomyces griseomycini]
MREDTTMRVRRTTSRKGLGRLTTALIAACAAGALATPLALAAQAEDAPTATAAGKQGDRLLPVPEVLRISSGPYAGFQFCGDPAGDPVAGTDTPTFAATLDSVAPPGAPEAGPGPRRKVSLEVETADGQQVIRKEMLSQSSHDVLYQPRSGVLDDGAYRWRVQVKEAGTKTPWTAWCSFTVQTG